MRSRRDPQHSSWAKWTIFWSGRWDLNPRPPGPKPGALPTAPRPDNTLSVFTPRRASGASRSRSARYRLARSRRPRVKQFTRSSLRCGSNPTCATARRSLENHSDAVKSNGKGRFFKAPGGKVVDRVALVLRRITISVRQFKCSSVDVQIQVTLGGGDERGFRGGPWSQKSVCAISKRLPFSMNQKTPFDSSMIVPSGAPPLLDVVANGVVQPKGVGNVDDALIPVITIQTDGQLFRM